MDKVIFRCSDCEHEFKFEYKEVADFPKVKCPKCKSNNLFITDYIYDTEPDRTPIKLGDRGCGTPGRFK